MNDAVGKNGLVTSRLTLSIISRISILDTDIPEQIERMEALKAVQLETNSIISERTVQEALIRKFLFAADRVCKLGEEVPFHTETKKKWLGPY